jgi:hypothetical protein
MPSISSSQVIDWSSIIQMAQFYSMRSLSTTPKVVGNHAGDMNPAEVANNVAVHFGVTGSKKDTVPNNGKPSSFQTSVN